MVADHLLHGAFEGLIGGGDGQEEVFGVQLPLRKQSLIKQHPCASLTFLLSLQQGGGDCMKEGDAGRGEEAGGRELFGSRGKVKEVVQGDGTPSN